MTAPVWLASVSLDSIVCGRLCMTLAHSLWQIGLLAVLAALVCWLSKRDNPERDYAVYVGALLLGLAALPITFALVKVPARSLATAPTSAEFALPLEKGLAETGPMAVVRPETVNPAKPVADSLPSTSSTKPQAAGWLWGAAPWLAGCYLAGVSLMILRLGRGIWKSHRLATHATPITTGPLYQSLHILARTWSLRIVPALAQAPVIVVPQVVGLLRPTILLPTSALTGLAPEELEMILAHELSHVRRYDMWVSLVQRLAETVLFFNPGLWYLSRRISTYREYCCDEQTCQVASREPSAARLRYAQALLHVLELSGKALPQVQLTALAATGNRPSELRRRVARLFGEPLREPVRISRGGLLVLIVGAAFLLVGPVAWQTAGEPAKELKFESASSSKDSSSESKVKVVAIGTHDEEPQRWWDAEGKFLENVPFTWKETGKVSTADKLWRRIVIRVEAPEADSGEKDINWQIVGASGSAGGELQFTEGFEPGKYLTRYFSLAEGSESFGLRVGLAAGEWKKVAQASGGGTLATGLASGKSIVFSAPLGNDEATTIIVSHNYFDQAFRIIAVDKKGKTHDTAGRGGSSAGQIYQSPATFRGLAPKEIERFEFQVRDYEWTEIKNLPVEPGSQAKANHSATESVPKENVNAESYDPASAKIAALEELRAYYEAIYQRVNVLHKQGLAGGEEAEKWLAFYHLSIVRAELATAMGKQAQAVEHYDEAIKAAEEIVKAQQRGYDNGTVTLVTVLEASALRAKAKLALSEAQQRFGEK